MAESQFELVDSCLLSTPKKGLRVTMPIGVNCPLKCKHCYQGGVAKYSIDLGTNVNSLVKMGESGVSKLYWDGAEPMTNPDIPLYLNTISHMKSKAGSPPFLFERVSIATNGVLVEQNQAEKLYSLGLRNIMVSLDGASEKVHDQFRNKGSFLKAINAISILKKIGYDVRIGTTIWRGMLDELEEIVALGERLGVKEVAFNWLQPVGEAMNHKEILVDDCYFQDISRKIAGIAEKYTGHLQISFHRGGSADPEKKCMAGKTVAYVSGEWVWPCSWIALLAPEYKSEMSLKEHSLKHILENDVNLAKFRAILNGLETRMGGCCPAMVKIYSGSFEGIDPIAQGGVHVTNQRRLK